MTLPINQILCGDCLEVMKDWPDNSVNCCISSPPYWSLRDYGVAGQLGLESTFEEYIDKLCDIYDEVKRVLRKDGTCWVNLGDTYASQGGDRQRHWDGRNKNIESQPLRHSKGVPEKSLCLVPERFAIEMVNRGWILRNVLIWHKPNPMPSSAKDRFTVDFEQVFFFTKSRKYWFEPQYEPFLTESNAERPRMGQGQNTRYEQKRGEHKNLQEKGQQTHSMHINRAAGKGEPASNPLGRNKRCVWTIPTQPCPEAHFATFPDKLVEPMILAGCPEFVCKKCGTARRKVYEKGEIMPDAKGYKPRGHKGDNKLVNRWNTGEDKLGPNMHYEQTFKGYTDCGCNAGFHPGVILDPFCGTGTACAVAAQLGRDYIGIDLKKEYVEQFAVPKTKAVETGVPVTEQRIGQGGLFDANT